MLGMMLVTHQTIPDGQQVRRLLIEEGVAIHSEMYFGVVIDRVSQRVVIIGSAEGGMDIESVAASNPEHIHRLSVDPVAGVDEAGLTLLAEQMGIPSDSQREAVGLFSSVYQAFWESDASLVEINPLILTEDLRLVALDAKFNFDDSALFRQPDIAALRDFDEENQDEVDAAAHGLNYIALDGSIGCLVNGAGLAMATMDIIKFYGGEPANFLDVGGGATTEQVTEAFKLMLRNESLRAILVNIFGGIMRCDVVAEGLVSAAQEVNLDVPLVVRLEGTNVERGREILAESNIEIIPAATMAEAAEKVVAAAS
jgi:succinyl-CoA synthetase beta subunit